jgi:hypothetical protein
MDPADGPTSFSAHLVRRVSDAPLKVKGYLPVLLIGNIRRESFLSVNGVSIKGTSQYKASALPGVFPEVLASIDEAY